MLDDSLFWTIDGESCPWPGLEVLEVMLHIARSGDGGWYLGGPVGERTNVAGFEITEAHHSPFEPFERDYEIHDMQEEFGGRYQENGNQQFRICPYLASLGSILQGFTVVAASAERLMKASIWTTTGWHPFEGEDSDEDDDDELNKYGSQDDDDLAWEFQCTAPKLSVTFTEARTLDWLVGEWRPDMELREAFRAIGRCRHGIDLKRHGQTKSMAIQLSVESGSRSACQIMIRAILLGRSYTIRS
jgi:hypothetical protein